VTLLTAGVKKRGGKKVNLLAAEEKVLRLDRQQPAQLKRGKREKPPCTRSFEREKGRRGARPRPASPAQNYLPERKSGEATEVTLARGEEKDPRPTP